MKEEELEALLDRAADRALKKHRDVYVCSLDIDREQHEEEHRFVRRLIKLFDRIDALQWGVLNKIIVTLVLGASAVFFVGGIVWILSKVPRP